jgi:hypothetical protein
VTLTFDHAIPEGYIFGDLSLQVGGGLEYLHHSPASCKKPVVREDIMGTQSPGV